VTPSSNVRDIRHLFVQTSHKGAIVTFGQAKTGPLHLTGFCLLWVILRFPFNVTAYAGLLLTVWRVAGQQGIERSPYILPGYRQVVTGP
jgi:hypothetical protein